MKKLLIFALLAGTLPAQQSFKNLTVLPGGTLTVNGPITSTDYITTGTGAIINDRTTPANRFVLYSDLDIFRVYSSSIGDVFKVGLTTGALTGPHIQNLGTGDSPAFYVPSLQKIELRDYFGSGATGKFGVLASVSAVNADFLIQDTAGTTIFDLNGVPFSLATIGLDLSVGTAPSPKSAHIYGNLLLDGYLAMGSGALSGTHLQNIGTSDSPSFASLSTAGAIGIGGNLSVGGTTISTGSASFSGTHSQNIGSGDSPTFSGVGINGGTLNILSGSTFNIQTGTINTVGGNISFGGTTNLNGTVSGTHGQNVGTGDSPSFSGITASGGSSQIFMGSSGNLYLRTFSGTPSCSGVTTGWIGYDTSGDHLYICSGGTLYTH